MPRQAEQTTWRVGLRVGLLWGLLAGLLAAGALLPERPRVPQFRVLIAPGD